MARKISINKGSEDSLVATYWLIVKLIGTEKMKELLLLRNIGKFRPLDWAMFLNAYGLAMAMINTPGVHLVKEKHKGALVTRWYDVTDYEVNPEYIGKQDLIYGLSYLCWTRINDPQTQTVPIIT